MDEVGFEARATDRVIEVREGFNRWGVQHTPDTMGTALSVLNDYTPKNCPAVTNCIFDGEWRALV